MRKAYSFQRGRIVKKFFDEDAPLPAGWVGEKAELNAAPGVDWSQPWLSVKSALKALGFEGSNKAEALEWAKSKGIATP